MENEILPDKNVLLKKFMPIRIKMANDAKKLVWTNGCFDILHIGHVRYLQQAKSYGDYLIVGVNSDSSYKKWKRKPGPVIPQDQRALVLLALSSVDFVILFDEPSPVDLIREIKPEIYIKGDNYNLNMIDREERKALESYGGEIRFCPGRKRISTTGIIQRILRLYGT